jgi:hypothetical protein
MSELVGRAFEQPIFQYWFRKMWERKTLRTRKRASTGRSCYRRRFRSGSWRRLGWLVGIGTIAMPGVGPFIAAGPILAALAGMGVGSVTGGLVGALVGAGIPEYEAKRYEGMINKGGFLVSVHCDNSEWTSKAKEMLERTGADDVSSTGEAGADFAETDKPRPRTHV